MADKYGGSGNLKIATIDNYVKMKINSIKLGFINDPAMKAIILSDIDLLQQYVDNNLIRNILHISRSVPELILIYYFGEVLRQKSSLSLNLPELIAAAKAKQLISPHTSGLLDHLVNIENPIPEISQQVSDLFFLGIVGLSSDLTDHFMNKL